MTLTNPQMLYGTAPAAPADEPYYIKRSVVFDGEDGNQYMHMAPPANGNRMRWTLNAWVKRVRPAGQGGSGENQGIFAAQHNSTASSALEFGGTGYADSFDNTIRFNSFNSGNNHDLWTANARRDYAAWAMYTWVYNSIDATEEERLKMYINGKRVTSTQAAQYPSNKYPSQNAEGPYNQTGSGLTTCLYIGAYYWSTQVSTWRNGMIMADARMMDGWVPEESGGYLTSLGEYTDGAWKAKSFTFPWNENTSSTTWSDLITDTGGFHGSYPKTMLFNGKVSDGAETANDHTATFTPSSSIEASNKIRVNGYWKTGTPNGTFDFKINGVSKLAAAVSEVGAATGGWYTLDTTTLTSLQFGNKTGTNTWMNIRAIEVDGTIMKDDTANNSFWLKFEDNSSAAALGKDSGPSTYVSKMTGGKNILSVTDSAGAVLADPVAYVTDSSASGLKVAIAGNGLVDVHHNVTNATGSQVSITDGGGIAVSTTDSRFYGKSIYFDGSNDYLQCTAPFTINDNSGTYTIEAWLKPDSSVFTDDTYRSFFNCGNNLNMGFWRSAHAHGTKLYVESDGNWNGFGIFSDALVQGRWYHIAFVRDGSSQKLYLNGVLQGSASSSSTTTAETNWTWGYESGNRWKGYMSDMRVYNVAKYSSAFTVATGLDFTPVNFSVASGNGNSGTAGDSLVDSPTNGLEDDDEGNGGELSANYAVWDQLTSSAFNGGTSSAVPSDGGLFIDGDISNYSTFAPSSGKWYCEFTYQTNPSSSWGGIGIKTTTADSNTSLRAMRSSNGDYFNGSSYSGYGSGFSNGDVIGVAWDQDNGTIDFYRNSNTSIGQQSVSHIVGVPTWIHAWAGPSGAIYANFGQKPFHSSMGCPTGYKCLCSTNIALAAADNDQVAKGGNSYNKSVLYTGNGGTNAITGVGFKAALVWVKNRAQYDHGLWDQVRGVHLYFKTNDNSAGGDASTSLTSFDNDGFTLGADAAFNSNSASHVAWCWEATSTSPNTTGSIDPTSAFVNTTSGFNILAYTGSNANGTIGHNLTGVPAFALFKRKADNADWCVYHKHVGNTGRLKLNTDDTTSTSSTFFQDTTPTSNLFTVGTSGDINGSDDYLAYIWQEVPGYMKTGIYEGNGTSNAFTNGPTIYTGFSPSFILIKCVSSGQHWWLVDIERNPFNTDTINTLPLNPATQTAERNSEVGIDILSNGFKLVHGEGGINGNGDDYIWVAFAETPFSLANAR